MLHKRFDFWLGVGTLLFLAASGLAVLSARLISPNGEADGGPLSVRAASVERKLRIDWDAQSPAVSKSRDATLEVTDGTTRESYPVSNAILRNGGLDYVRRTDDVLLRLTLRTSNGDQQAFVRSVSAVPEVIQTAATEPSVVEKKRTNRRARTQTRARRRR